MQIEVLSLGGSLIVPDDVDVRFLFKYCALLKKLKDRKFIVVVGGGSTARKYIKSLKHRDVLTRARAGIIVTRLHAWFLARFYGKGSSHAVPRTMKEVENLLKKNDVVFVGALRFHDKQTSDGTAAQLAHFLKTRFINITNVSGLFTSDPAKNKNAKLVSQITAEDFYKRAMRTKFTPGQHFVLDQHAAEIVKNTHVTTYIVGGNIKNLENLLKGKHFIGTKLF